MNWKRIIGIVVTLGLIILVAVKLLSNKKITEKRVYQYDKKEAIHVETETIKIQNISSEQFFPGTFEAEKESKLSAETQGKINTILVDAGDYVKKGQSLIQLDNALLQLQLKSVEVQIEGLEADVRRYTALAEADAVQGIQLEKASLGLKGAQVQRSTIIEQINKTTVKAPFSGIITAKMTEEGAFAAPGMPLLQISALDQLKFSINVSESDLNRFQSGKTYEVRPDAYPDLRLSGVTSLVGSKANVGSSFPVQFVIKNTPDHKIKAGMFGKVTIHSNSSERGLIIPSSSLTGSAEKPQVYLVKNGVAYLTDITVSSRFKNKVVVASGISEGDVIVSGGLINLFDKANVKSN